MKPHPITAAHGGSGRACRRTLQLISGQQTTVQFTAGARCGGIGPVDLWSTSGGPTPREAAELPSLGKAWKNPDQARPIEPLVSVEANQNL